MTDAVPAFYPASYFQYLKHPTNVVRMGILFVLMVVACFGPVMLLSIPAVLTALFFGYQYYHFRTLYPKRTVTKTFGEIIAGMEEPSEEPVTSSYVMELTAGGGLKVYGDTLTVTSPNPPVISVESPHASVSADEGVGASADELCSGCHIVDGCQCGVNAAPTQEEIKTAIDTSLQLISDEDVAQLNAAFFPKPKLTIDTGGRVTGIELPVLPLSIETPEEAAARTGFANKSESALAPTADVRKDEYGVVRDRFGWPRSIETPDWVPSDTMTTKVDYSPTELGVERTADDEPRMAKEPYWLTRLRELRGPEFVGRWTANPDGKVAGQDLGKPYYDADLMDDHERDGEEIVLSKQDFHRAACTPDTCVCTREGFFKAVEATKDDEVFVADKTATTKMPSALFSRAVERQLEAGRLRQTSNGRVRAVRDMDAPIPARRLTPMPTSVPKPIFDIDYAPAKPAELTKTGQLLLAEMLKAIPADLLTKDEDSVAAPSGAMFDPSSYVDDKGRSGTTAQIDVVRNLMQDNAWRTLTAISASTGFPEASISARLRDLRKTNFGGYNVERRYVSKGLYEYRLAP